MALSDAAQISVPLIVSDAGDMGDLVRDYNAGFVFRKGNSTELAEKLMEAVRSDPSIFHRGVRSLSTKFDISETCGSWLNDIGLINTKLV